MDGFQLRDLPFAARLALTLLLLVTLGGWVASGLHMQAHHENRDDRPGLSVDDLRGAYHGVNSPSSLLRALEANHPDGLEGATPLPAAKRKTLLSWLRGSELGEAYDDLDRGDDAPAEILAAHCVECHSRTSKNEGGRSLPLEYWDDVKRVAFSREIAATDAKILLASTHTHAISLATITILLGALMLLSSWPRALRSGLPLLAAVGLSVDIASWWLAREVALFVDVLLAAGVLYAVSVVLMLLALMIDLWRPQR